ncbi:MAG: ATP-binding cassette domain-containing protein [Promethearchaeota archaeon]
MAPIFRVVNVELISSDDPEPRIKDINLTIEKGDFVLLSGEGETSAGKTSLLNVLSTYEKPTNGQVFIQNEDITVREDLYKRIRGKHYYDERIKHFYAPVNPPIIRCWQSTLSWLFPKQVSTIILENIKNYYPRVAFYELKIAGMERVYPFLAPKEKNKSKSGWHYKEPPPEAQLLGRDEEAAKKYLSVEWKLPPEYFDFKLGNLSGGFKRQVLNAAAFLGFCVEDAILIADYPDVNLDVFKRNMLAFHLIDRNKQGHTTVVTITHSDVRNLLTQSLAVKHIQLKAGRLS